MNKPSLYNVEVVEVTRLRKTTSGNSVYKILVVDDDLDQHYRKTRANSSASLEAKNLRSGDVVDLVADGNGSIVLIKKYPEEG